LEVNGRGRRGRSELGDVKKSESSRGAINHFAILLYLVHDEAEQATEAASVAWQERGDEEEKGYFKKLEVESAGQLRMKGNAVDNRV